MAFEVTGFSKKQAEMPACQRDSKGSPEPHLPACAIICAAICAETGGFGLAVAAGLAYAGT